MVVCLFRMPSIVYLSAVGCVTEGRVVRLAKNDFGSVFGLVSQKTALFGSVSFLQN